MNGLELKSLLFTKRGEQAEFAAYLKITPQALKSKFDADKVDNEILRKYAIFKKYDVEDFLKWAAGEMQQKQYPVAFQYPVDEGDSTANLLMEPPGSTYAPATNELLKNELKKVFTENVNLHRTLADRGELIINLLGK